MASICYFWRISPAEYKALLLPEIEALHKYQAEYTAEVRRQQRR